MSWLCFLRISVVVFFIFFSSFFLYFFAIFQFLKNSIVFQDLGVTLSFLRATFQKPSLQAKHGNAFFLAVCMCLLMLFPSSFACLPGLDVTCDPKAYANVCVQCQQDSFFFPICILILFHTHTRARVSVQRRLVITP